MTSRTLADLPSDLQWYQVDANADNGSAPSIEIGRVELVKDEKLKSTLQALGKDKKSVTGPLVRQVLADLKLDDRGSFRVLLWSISGGSASAIVELSRATEFYLVENAEGFSINLPFVAASREKGDWKGYAFFTQRSLPLKIGTSYFKRHILSQGVPTPAVLVESEVKAFLSNIQKTTKKSGDLQWSQSARSTEIFAGYSLVESEVIYSRDHVTLGRGLAYHLKQRNTLWKVASLTTAPKEDHIGIDPIGSVFAAVISFETEWPVLFIPDLECGALLSLPLEGIPALRVVACPTC